MGLNGIQLLQKSYSDRVFKYGKSSAVTNTDSIIWDVGGTYSGWMETPEIVRVSSSSADDKVGGGGCTAVELSGIALIDGIMQRNTEVVQLNGTSYVNTANSYYSVWRVRSYSSEDGDYFTGPNHGAISAIKTSNTDVCARILATNGQTLMAIWQCAENEYAELLDVNIYPQFDNTALTTESLTVKVLYSVYGTNSWNDGGDVVFASGTVVRKEFKMPQLILPKTKIVLTALLSAAGPISVSANFELRLFNYAG